MTFYGCGEKGHMYQVCPKRRGRASVSPDVYPTTWVDITARSKQQRKIGAVGMVDAEPCNVEANHAGLYIARNDNAARTDFRIPLASLLNKRTNRSDRYKATVPAVRTRLASKQEQDRMQVRPWRTERRYSKTHS
jgi:hypothetical protein